MNLVPVAALMMAACLPCLAAAQTSLSIEEALRLAEKSSEAVEIGRADLTRAAGEKVRARAEWLPEVSGAVVYDRALASEYEGVFDGGGGGQGIDFGELPFGRENTWRLSLSAQQNLFAGGRSRARLRAARAAHDGAVAALSSARANSVWTATQVYYDALLADQLLAIAEATLTQAEATLAQTKLGRAAGSQSEFDLLRAEVTRDNQRPLVVQRKVQRELAYVRLKQQLDVPLETELRLTSGLDDASSVHLAQLGGEIVQANPDNASARAPLRQAAALTVSSEAAVDMARAGHLPQLNANMQYGRVAYPSGVLPGWDDFRTNWTVGVVLSIPIFNGLRTTGDVEVAEAELAASKARLREVEESTRLDTRDAEEQLLAARAVYEASAGTVEQAARAHEIAELRYEQGVSTQLELTDARLQLQQARANRAQAARDLQVARMRIALLSELPAR